MWYSFEVGGAPKFQPSKVRLFCKLDATPEEMAFIRQARLLDQVLYEMDIAPRDRSLRGFAKKLVSMPLDPLAHRKAAAKSKASKPGGLTIRDMLKGSHLILNPFEIPEVERVIEARILAFAETLQLATQRIDTPGRTNNATP